MLTAFACGCAADGDPSITAQTAAAGGSGNGGIASASPAVGAAQAAGSSGLSTGSSPATARPGALPTEVAMQPHAGAAAQTSAAGSAAAGAAAGTGGQALAAAGSGAGQSGAPAMAMTMAMAMASAGAAGAQDGADSDLPPGATNFTAVCEGGETGMDSDAAGRIPGLDVGREFAGVKFLARSPNEIVSFKTTLVVPETPSARQTLFIWPGLQSRDGAADPGRIGNGVLQPVLTWGPSCAPKMPSMPYDAGWWISGMYVNVTSGAAGPTGCAGGDYLTTSLGDWLEIDMFLKDGMQVQTIKNVQTDEMVDFSIDLKGQVQNEAMWLIEVPSGSSVRPAEDTIWLQNVLTFKQPVESCQPRSRGSADYFSTPTLSPDGLHCCWDKIILKADRSGTP